MKQTLKSLLLDNNRCAVLEVALAVRSGTVTICVYSDSIEFSSFLFLSLAKESFFHADLSTMYTYNCSAKL